MSSFYVENFGCRATQADGAAIERELLERGMSPAEAAHQAEVVVLNTCTVTASADHDVRAAIRRIHRQNPGCRILVTGCYAQRAPQEIAAIPGVSAVIGNSHKRQVGEIAKSLTAEDAEGNAEDANTRSLRLRSGQALDSRQRQALARDDTSKSTSKSTTGETEDTEQTQETPEAQIYVGDIFAHTELVGAPVFEAGAKTRPNLKVQDGCNNRCSFCIIPFVRGRSRSLPLEEAVREVRSLVEAGYREVVISGINLGRWGRDLAGSKQVATRNKQQARSEIENSLFPQGLKPLVDAADGGTAKAVPFPRNTPTSARGGQMWGTNNPGFPVPRSPFTESTSAGRAQLRFVDLVRGILEGTRLEKLRISSVEPMDWSDELIALVASSPRIAKHAHVPMQSGSDRILRAMHRKYRPWHYAERVRRIRAAMPTAAIGADVMVGFPGESDADFEQTRRMVEELPFTYLHVFTYSPRPGTPAARMPGQAPPRVVKERNRILRELAAEKKLRFMGSFMGREIEAITLNVYEDGYTEALTDNYLKLRIPGRHEANQWVRTRVESVTVEGMVASSLICNWVICNW